MPACIQSLSVPSNLTAAISRLVMAGHPGHPSQFYGMFPPAPTAYNPMAGPPMHHQSSYHPPMAPPYNYFAHNPMGVAASPHPVMQPPAMPYNYFAPNPAGMPAFPRTEPRQPTTPYNFIASNPMGMTAFPRPESRVPPPGDPLRACSSLKRDLQPPAAAAAAELRVLIRELEADL